MKVLLILGSNPSVSPYVFPYLESCLENDCETHLLYWKRKAKEESIPKEVVTHVFDVEILDNISILRKIPSFIKFKRFVIRTLKKGKYDKVIVFDTQFAVLLGGYLVKKHNKKFIFDMRDLSYEKYSFYRKRMNKVEESSAATFVSSDGFRQFFDKQDNIYTFHNVQKKDCLFSTEKLIDDSVINISFWGLLRDFELNLKLVNYFKNNKCFKLNYHGILSEKMLSLKEYCIKNKIDNVSFFGEYSQGERLSFSKHTFFVNNLFESNAFLNPIMSNKFYDALIMGLPQLCLKGSYMGDIVDKNAIGLSIEINQQLPEILKKYVDLVDMQILRMKCNKLLNSYLSENEKALDVIKRFVSANKKMKL